MNQINGRLNIYSEDGLKDNCTIEIINKRAIKIYNEIQNRTDTGSDEYNKLVALYRDLRSQYRDFFKGQIERESSFKKVTTN